MCHAPAPPPHAYSSFCVSPLSVEEGGAASFWSKDDVHPHVLRCPLNPPPAANQMPGFHLTEEVVSSIQAAPGASLLLLLGARAREGEGGDARVPGAGCAWNRTCWGASACSVITSTMPSSFPVPSNGGTCPSEGTHLLHFILLAKDVCTHRCPPPPQCRKWPRAWATTWDRCEPTTTGEEEEELLRQTDRGEAYRTHCCCCHMLAVW